MAEDWLIIKLMLSWDALDPFRFKPAGVVTAAFLGIARTDFRTAAQYACGLPYGRNSDPNDPLIVLAEQRGTCSTKHAHSLGGWLSSNDSTLRWCLEFMK
jgi:hypothetical protein